MGHVVEFFVYTNTVADSFMLCYIYVLYCILSLEHQQNTFRDCHKQKFTERYMGTSVALFCIIWVSLCYIKHHARSHQGVREYKCKFMHF